MMEEKEKKVKKALRVKDEEKYNYAFLLYMKRTPQNTIAERVGVSQQTLTRWKDQGAWELKRSAKVVSRDQIINKILTKINDKLDSEEDFNGDDFAKLSSQLSKIKAGYTRDDVADILTDFGDWMIEQSALDKQITTEFIQILTKYHDKYLMRKSDGNR